MKNKKSIKTLKYYLFLLMMWIAFILIVIYIKRPYYFDGHPRMNFIPALNLIDDVKIWKSEGSLCFRHLLPWIYNLTIYVIPGILLALACPKTPYIRLILGCIGFSFFINTFRLITRWGAFDVDDIILNTLGFTVGYFAAQIIRRVSTHLNQ